MKRITPKPTPTPDKVGSRATSIAHITKHQFARLLAGWRKQRGLTRAAVAEMFYCTAGTIAAWERGRCRPQGVSLPTIIAHIKGGAL